MKFFFLNEPPKFSNLSKIIFQISILIFIVLYNQIKINKKISFTYSQKFSINSSNLIIFNEIKECLKFSSKTRGFKDFELADFETRKKNYQLLLSLTEKYRPEPPITHTYKDYSGPWVEHHFYRTFCCNRSLEDFGPFIPIFVPWLDITAVRSYLFKEMYSTITSNLLPNALYITVTQDDNGIESHLRSIEDLPQNLLILSGSGYGNIPILMNHFERDLIDNFENEYPLSFVGDDKPSYRSFLFQEIKKDIPNFIAYKGHDWLNIVKKSKFNLIPRGYAPGTFRLMEILQLGGIPIILWNKHRWIPYLNSTLPLEKIGFVGNYDDIHSIIPKFIDMSINEINERRSLIKTYRNTHFTTKGSMYQIELLMKYGFSVSDLNVILIIDI